MELRFIVRHRQKQPSKCCANVVAEKILNSKDTELRRSLFLLKQLFQNDKDLVHEFVHKDGLECLVKVASETKEHNYINYILRALGQLMLFVDGMNGVIGSGETVQWLYSVLASGFRLVVKTALKLLIVFVEYAEANALLLVRAVTAVDEARNAKPWANLMHILADLSNQDDLELILYSMILVNTVCVCNEIKVCNFYPTWFNLTKNWP